MENGFHQIEISPNDRAKTAFLTREGIYQWKRMPFGLINAPFTFQKIVTNIFKKFLWKFIIVYMDDILIYSQNLQEHIMHIKILFQVLQNYGFKLNKKKTHILKTKIDFLGFQFVENKMEIPLIQKMRALEYKEPKTITELRGFIGFANYFRRFIKNYTNKMLPLYERIKKNEKVISLKENERNAFEEIKKCINESIPLQLPDLNKEFSIFTDASNFVISAVLMQKDSTNELTPIFYLSRKLNKSEINYTVTEKECLGIVWAIKMFQIYLVKKFFILSDHKALVWLMKQKDCKGRIGRWIIFLQNYNFEINYIKGTENTIADGLTRYFINETHDNIYSISPNEDPRTMIKKIHDECGHGGIASTYLVCLRRMEKKIYIRQ